MTKLISAGCQINLRFFNYDCLYYFVLNKQMITDSIQFYPKKGFCKR